MNAKQDWLTALESLPSSASWEEIDALVARMRDAAHGPGHAALTAFARKREPDTDRSILVRLGPDAIDALIEQDFTGDADERAFLLQVLVEAELALRARVIAKVEKLLDDREALSELPAHVQLEVRPPRRRVCDEAYVSMRRLVHPEEDQVGYHVESDAFLHLPEELKDTKIQEARTTHTWNLRPPTPDEAGY